MIRTAAKSMLKCAGRRLTKCGGAPGVFAVENRWVSSTRECSSNSGSIEHVELSNTPRRAVLYVPGHSEKMLKKLTDLKVDCAVMECEDGVAVNKKADARELVCHMLDTLDLPHVTDVAVRINSMDSGFAEEDLSTILKAQRLPNTIFFPKVDSVEHIYWLVKHLKSSLRDRDLTAPLKIIIYTESAIALLRLPEIISEALELFSSEPYFLDGVVFGSDDYCANIGATRSHDGKELLYARQKVVSIAKAFGLQAIDMVHIDIKDQDALEKFSKEGARMGFTGKQVIHPSQVSIVQQAFSPSPERIQWATQLLAAFKKHQQTGEGAFMFEGSMIDMPLVLQAKNIIELAKIDTNPGS